MTVMPGSLDYLYNLGILNRVPYEAYAMPQMGYNGIAGSMASPYYQAPIQGPYPVNMQSGMYPTQKYHNAGMNNMMSRAYSTSGMLPQVTGSQYLDASMQGDLYTSYNSPDTFVCRDSCMHKPLTNQQEKRNFAQSMKDFTVKAKATYDSTPTWIKGLAGAGVILGTVACLFRGKPAAAKSATQDSGFWEKIKNLFRKK